jgi:hypothetical protein
MSPQADFIVSNGTGAAVRSDLNVQFAAIVSNNSGATEPATMYAYQWWADTTAGLLKLRNSANSAWITMRQLDGEFSTVPVENGSAAAPSIYFKDSGTDSGFFSPGTDAVAISTAGTNRLHITSGGLVGIGTSAPAVNLQVNAASDVTIALSNSSSVTSGSRGTIAMYNSALSTVGNISFAAVTDNVGTEIQFYTRPAAGSLTQTMTLDSAGRLGIGTTSPRRTLEVSGADGVLCLNSTDTSTGSSQLLFGDDDDDNIGRVYYDHATNDMGFYTNTSEKARISSDGSFSSVIPGGSTLYPQFGCRAWVNFNGTGTVAIRGSGNVSSITDNGTGDYTVNFTTALADANYSTQLNGGFNNLASYGRHVEIYGTPTAAAVRCFVQPGAADMEIMTCAIFR